MHVLEGVGAIDATRGRVRVLDRAKLEEMVEGCYGVAEATASCLLRFTPSHRSPSVIDIARPPSLPHEASYPPPVLQPIPGLHPCSRPRPVPTIRYLHSRSPGACVLACGICRDAAHVPILQLRSSQQWTLCRPPSNTRSGPHGGSGPASARREHFQAAWRYSPWRDEMQTIDAIGLLDRLDLALKTDEVLLHAGDLLGDGGLLLRPRSGHRH